MLTEFDKALAVFEQDAYSLLHEFHFNPEKELSKFKVQIQAQALATDIGYMSMAMQDLYLIAIQQVSDEMDDHAANYMKQEISETIPPSLPNNDAPKYRPGGEQKISLAQAKFAAAFKAFLFFIRAYQDAVYKIGLGILNESTGPKSSMTKAVDVKTRQFVTTSPIGNLLASRLPQYASWFSSIREKRNSIKYGVGNSFTSSKNFITGETQVAIKLNSSADTDLRSLSLDDVSQALRMSADVTKMIIELGLSRGKLG